MPSKEIDTYPEKEVIRSLESLLDYMKYVYEEELKRAERFHQATRTYILFIASTFAGALGALEWLGLQPSMLIRSTGTWRTTLLAWALCLSTGALVASFALTILVIKVWKKERLCSPVAATMGAKLASSREVLEGIVSDFAVAADRNGRINDQKGRLLASASWAYRLGLILLAAAGIFYILQ